MKTQYLIPVYAVYATIAIGLTVWLARTLFKNGAVFLRDVFDDNRDLAEAVNRLLVVGFYLLNLGYAALLLRADSAATVVSAVETLAFKLGLLLLSLGVMHFANMYLFHRIRRRTVENHTASAYRIPAEAHAHPQTAHPQTAHTQTAHPQTPQMQSAWHDAHPSSAFELLERKRAEQAPA